jgi:two-component system sensor histidine kinase MprB
LKLRTRIVLTTAVAVAIAVVLVSAAAFILARRELRSEIDESLIERALVIQSLADDPRGIVGADGPFVLPLGVLGGRGPSFDTVYYKVTLPTGDVLIPEGQTPLPRVDEDVAQRPASLSDVNVGGVHMRMITFVADPLIVIQMARPLTEVDATLAGLAVALSVVGLIGVLLATGAGVLVARSALKPIDDLAEAAEHVAETQDLAARIEVGSNDEVGRLARNFNSMLSALEESRTQQQRLVRDAGHELRTPLTALRTNIELLGRTKNLSDVQRRELITAAEAEVRDLSVLVGEVVDVASDRYTEDPVEDLFLDDIVAQSVERAERRTTIDIEVVSDRSPVNGRSAALARAVDNLLDNALKWGSDGEQIVVAVADGRVSVRDHGPGIDEADRDRVFDRFYRSPSARSMTGSGLGLSIVMQIAEAHGGEVFVETPDDGGAVVGFEIPSR